MGTPWIYTEPLWRRRFTSSEMFYTKQVLLRVSHHLLFLSTYLTCSPFRPAKPLRIITGRGTHSANGVGVLGPAVKSALEEDGWNVRKYDGGLVVSGRNAWRS